MMPSKKEYDLVSDDGYDSRIPLHNEDAFQHGIQFQAKFIGTLDVPRPSSRVEIVAAMRRIRYEFKAKAIKKKKVNIAISVEGVKVNQRRKKKKISQWPADDKKSIIVQHPIYRIFYVSHDSQDLKIWSYIARDGPSNVFKCNVFKAYKKEQAMRIVRTIGQAFEVCHKLSVTGVRLSPEPLEESESCSNSVDTDKRSSKSTCKDVEEKESRSRDSTIESSRGRATPPNELALRQAQQLLYQMAAKTPQIGGTTISSPMSSPGLLDDSIPDPQLPISSQHQVQLLRQQVEHQHQQTQVAIAQVHLLKDQLAAETAARIESQARAHQLMLQNKDLLDHMSQMMMRLREIEIKNSDSHSHDSVQFTQSQASVLPDPTTPQCGPVYMPRLSRGLDGSFSPVSETAKLTFETDSPDSGHREMSAENLSARVSPSEAEHWQGLYGSDIQYSYGFSSPVKLKNTPYEMTATVNSNPFANSRDEEFTTHRSNFDKTGSRKDEKLKVITPLPSQDASGNRLELKLNVTPRIKPPPEFRNSASLRNSQSSDQSTSDSSSVREGNINLTSDSDYYSHTGSSVRTSAPQTGYQKPQTGFDVNTHCDDKRESIDFATMKQRQLFEYHFNNLNEESSALQRYFESELESQKRRSYVDERRQSYSDEENTETLEDAGLVKPPSPTPPPRRLEAITLEEFERFNT